MNPTKPNRNRTFRFTLTNLFALVVVIAISVAWLADRKQLKSQIDVVNKRLGESKAKIEQASEGWGIASSAIEINSVSSDFSLSPTIRDFHWKLERRLLLQIEGLFKRKTDVDEATDIASFSASNLAGQSLFLLGWKCDSPEAFIKKSVAFFGQQGVAQPHYITGSESHRSYVDFLSDSLNASKEYGNKLEEVNSRYANVDNLEIGIRGPMDRWSKGLGSTINEEKAPN